MEQTSGLSLREQVELADVILINGRPQMQLLSFLISHRFSTVRMADYIAVLDDGRIVEHGSHAELLALGGRYARLYTMQAKKYR